MTQQTGVSRWAVILGALCVFLAGAVASSAHAQGGNVASLIRTTDTALWSPVSSDPSGLVYLDDVNRLLISDGEINEYSSPPFTGDNLFEASLSGNLLDTATTIGFSGEPAGVTVNPFNRHLFFSQDVSGRKIHEVDPGPDGNFGTADDIRTEFPTGPFGAPDPEGITYNPALNVLHIAAGFEDQVFTVDPGANGLFDGIPASGGDDVVTSFSTSAFGVDDPEGIVYDSDFGHLYVVGKPADVVAHVTVDGTLLRLIDISAANADKPAGLAYAPGSSSPGTNHLYIVDRGDDGTTAATIDGRLFEMALPAFAGNSVPALTILSPSNGQSFDAQALFTLEGNASDAEDGSLSASIEWESDLEGTLGTGSDFQISLSTIGTHLITARVEDSAGAMTSANVVVEIGENLPPIVSIQTPDNNSFFSAGDPVGFVASANDARDGDVSGSLVWSSDVDGNLGTGASLSVSGLSEGPHVIAAQAEDSGGLTNEDSIQLTITPAGTNVVNTQIASSSNDAEEGSGGVVMLADPDLELVRAGGGATAFNQTVGLRFPGLSIPAGATINQAWLQFEADETDGGNASLTIQAQAANTASAFSNATNNLSSRARSTASVSWTPDPWSVLLESGPAQRSPDISSLVQEVVSRPGWSSGNAMAFLLTGSGKRVATAFDTRPAGAAILHVEYSIDPALNTAPQASITLPGDGDVARVCRGYRIWMVRSVRAARSVVPA